ncbi:MAG: polysaccharide biosynthesis C-terminal domain-containing protein [Bacteroidota bacterium]
MNQVKKLAGQTMIYGLGSILPRVLNYLLLTTFYTYLLGTKGFGILSELYAEVAIVLVVIEFGMESGYFRHAKLEGDSRKVFSHTFGFILIMTILWLVAVTLWTRPIADMLKYSGHPEYIRWIAWIIALDAVTLIPFAKIRQEERPMRFAVLKVLNVVINLVIVFLFLGIFPAIQKKTGDLPAWLYNPEIGVGYVFISNLAASAVMLLLLLPEFRSLRFAFDPKLMKKILFYSAPLVIVGLAGSINDSGDKILLKFLWPDPDQAQDMVGEYSASYRLAILITLFTQMFRYAFEPFLFNVSDQKDAKETYAMVMKYFILSGLVICLGTTLYIDLFQYLLGPATRGGLAIVPIVMLGYLFLGIYYNLSVWYKIKDLTRYAALMAGVGAAVTIGLNVILIPEIGYMGSALATLACYLVMMVISYFWGRKVYPIPYETGRLVGWILLAAGIYAISWLLRPDALWLRLSLNTLLFLLFTGIIARGERKLLRSVIGQVRARFRK